MITIEKLAACIRSGFNMDYWIRVGTAHDQSLVTDHEFRLVSDYVEDVHLWRQGRATDAHRAASEARLRAACENAAVFDALQAAAAVHSDRLRKGPTFVERAVDFLFGVKTR